MTLTRSVKAVGAMLAGALAGVGALAVGPFAITYVNPGDDPQAKAST